MAGGIKFGTDGWRGIIADDFTFENVRICSQAVADYVLGSEGKDCLIVIGYDTRFLSQEFATATAEVLAGNGIKVNLCQKTVPTPVVSHAVVACKAAGGIVITASHNPSQYNGFKYKSADGASAPNETVEAIEKNIAAVIESRQVKVLSKDEAVKKGLIVSLDPDPAYFEQVRRLVDVDQLRRAGLKIAVDAMFGAGSGYLRRLLSGGNNEITEINGEWNPAFPGIHPEPIAKDLGKLSKTVVEGKFDIGIAQDGDADRIGIIDENGIFLNQLQVFSLLALYLLEVRKERRPIVKSITASDMLNKLGEIYNVPVFETPVGFKYVAPVMIREDAAIGGEESGGYGFRGHLPERDSIVAALFFLDFMLKTGKTPGQLLQFLFSKVGPHYYDRIDYPTSPDKHKSISERIAGNAPKEIGGMKVVRVDKTDGYRFILEEGSWLLIRFSGTEPLIRTYAESDSPDKITRLLAAAKSVLGV